jgi:hypothetical protein
VRFLRALHLSIFEQPPILKKSVIAGLDPAIQFFTLNQIDLNYVELT